jgi:hypothetical protein
MTIRTALAAFMLGIHWATARRPAAMSERSDRPSKAPRRRDASGRQRAWRSEPSATVDQ